MSLISLCCNRKARLGVRSVRSYVVCVLRKAFWQVAEVGIFYTRSDRPSIIIHRCVTVWLSRVTCDLSGSSWSVFSFVTLLWIQWVVFVNRLSFWWQPSLCQANDVIDDLLWPRLVDRKWRHVRNGKVGMHGMLPIRVGIVFSFFTGSPCHSACHWVSRAWQTTTVTHLRYTERHRQNDWLICFKSLWWMDKFAHCLWNYIDNGIRIIWPLFFHFIFPVHTVMLSLAWINSRWIWKGHHGTVLSRQWSFASPRCSVISCSQSFVLLRLFFLICQK